MFKTLKISLKFGSISAKWVNATGIDPGDNGQIARKAMEYINNLHLEPEDAWLTALVNWMQGMPWEDSKKMMATGLLQFINEYERKIALSAQTIIAAREVAEDILADSGSTMTKMKVAGLIASTIDYIISDSGISTLLSGSIVLDNNLHPSFRGGMPTGFYPDFADTSKKPDTIEDPERFPFKAKRRITNALSL